MFLLQRNNFTLKSAACLLWKIKDRLQWPRILGSFIMRILRNLDSLDCLKYLSFLHLRGEASKFIPSQDSKVSIIWNSRRLSADNSVRAIPFFLDCIELIICSQDSRNHGQDWILSYNQVPPSSRNNSTNYLWRNGSCVWRGISIIWHCKTTKEKIHKRKGWPKRGSSIKVKPDVVAKLRKKCLNVDGRINFIFWEMKFSSLKSTAWDNVYEQIGCNLWIDTLPQTRTLQKHSGAAPKGWGNVYIWW